MIMTLRSVLGWAGFGGGDCEYRVVYRSATTTREGDNYGRSAASEQRHPGTRKRAACADVLRTRPRRFRDGPERVEIRRLRVRDGAQSVGFGPAAGLPAVHAQPCPDRQGGTGTAGD